MDVRRAAAGDIEQYGSWLSRSIVAGSLLLEFLVEQQEGNEENETV